MVATGAGSGADFFVPVPKRASHRHSGDQAAKRGRKDCELGCLHRCGIEGLKNNTVVLREKECRRSRISDLERELIFIYYNFHDLIVQVFDVVLRLIYC